VELELTTREQEIKDMLLLVKPHEKEAPPKQLLPSGIDAVIWFDCQTQECLRRADGRRIDADIDVNAKVFHIEDVPPPTTEAPLCERLEPLSDDSNSVASLVDRFLAFN